MNSEADMIICPSTLCEYLEYYQGSKYLSSRARNREKNDAVNLGKINFN